MVGKGLLIKSLVVIEECIFMKRKYEDVYVIIVNVYIYVFILEI